MASPAARDQFLRQMEQIVEGIKQSRMKVSKLTLQQCRLCGGEEVLGIGSPSRQRPVLPHQHETLVG